MYDKVTKQHLKLFSSLTESILDMYIKLYIRYSSSIVVCY